jgi:hypothetical protein
VCWEVYQIMGAGRCVAVQQARRHCAVHLSVRKYGPVCIRCLWEAHEKIYYPLLRGFLPNGPKLDCVIDVLIRSTGSMTLLVKREPPNNTNFNIGRSISHKKMKSRDCDRPMIKLVLLGGARFTNCAIRRYYVS